VHRLVRKYFKTLVIHINCLNMRILEVFSVTRVVGIPDIYVNARQGAAAEVTESSAFPDYGFRRIFFGYRP
jgi:hypothetical protein